jgi:hypothetical protein
MSVMGFARSNNERTSDILPLLATDYCHTLIEGQTGSGKTASLIMPILSDRIQKKHMIVFNDEKGVEHKKVKYLAQKYGRLEDVVELGKPYGVSLNLLATFDINVLKTLIKETVKSKDPFWANSAANLAEGIVQTLRQMHDITCLFRKFGIDIKNSDNILDKFELDFDIHIWHEPSFRDIASVTGSPKIFNKFKSIIAQIPTYFKSLVDHDFHASTSILDNHIDLMAKILIFEKTIHHANHFSISEEKNDVNVGNNAVMQTLNNAISGFINRDYINEGEITLDELMDGNAIIIIDSQSFGSDLMKQVFEMILKKCVRRLRVNKHKPTSVFIDEANRVLPDTIDLHNDVLREAQTEIIMAIQNNEQMLLKFGDVMWASIRKNLSHDYFIDTKHLATYSHKEGTFKPAPMIFPQKELNVADCNYYTIEKNRTKFISHFLGCTIPKNFIVQYDIDTYELTSSILLEDINTCLTYQLFYYGQEIVDKAKMSYSRKIDTNLMSENDLLTKLDIILSPEDFEAYDTNSFFD